VKPLRSSVPTDDQRAQASRPLSRLAGLLLMLLGAHFVLTLASPTSENLRLGALGLAVFPFFGVAMLLSRRGSYRTSAILTVGALFAAAIAAQAMMPQAAPIVVLLPIAVAAIALPIMTARGARIVALAAIVTILVLRVMYEAANFPEGPLLGNIAAVVSTGLLSAVALSMLTRFRDWNEHLLRRAGLATEDLQRGNEALELRVAERTGELAVELERSRQISDRLRLLESVAVHVSDGILILEAQPAAGLGRNILYANDAAARLTGYDAAETVGRPLRLLRSPRTAAADLERVRIALDTGVSVDVELQNRRKDGTDFWAHQSTIPVYGGDGDLLHWVIVMRDITQERALRESFSNRNQFLEALHEASLGLLNRNDRRDVLGRILESACRVVGTEHGTIDLLIPGDDSLLNTIVASGIFRNFAHIPTRRGEGALGRVIATGQRQVIDDYRTWSGRLTDPALDALASFAGLPIIASGRVVGAFGVAFTVPDKVIGSDVLDLLEQFAALAAIAVDNGQLVDEGRTERDLALQITHSMGQGLAVIDAAGRLEYVNPTLGQGLGYPEPNPLVGRPASLLFSDAAKTDLLLPEFEMSRGERRTFERTMRRLDGAEWVALVSITPRFRAERADGVIAVFTDLTAIKQTADALEQARDRAQDASRLKSEFLAMMSHEIRTPLNAILGMNELLLDTPLDAKQRELAQIAFESSQALMSVINDILDFSRIEAGKLELAREPVRIGDTVTKSAEMFRRKADERALFLDVRLDRGLPNMVVGDAGRLRQVLVNLIGNSLKFTHVGGVVVTADVVERRSDCVVVRFAVQDTGIGLTDAIRDRLFEPFTQGSDFLTRRHGGTGLGLAICRRIVELMRGEIKADGAPGDGATFMFTAVFDMPAVVPV